MLYCCNYIGYYLILSTFEIFSYGLYIIMFYLHLWMMQYIIAYFKIDVAYKLKKKNNI